MIDSPTVWVSSLIITVAYVIWFELRFSHECWWLKQWHLAALFTARKNHDNACAGIKLSLSVRLSRWTQEFTCRVQHVMAHFYWLSAMSIKLPRICSLFSLVKISWYSWHFAALGGIMVFSVFSEWLELICGFYRIKLQFAGILLCLRVNFKNKFAPR